jgi:hypothetical protein
LSSTLENKHLPFVNVNKTTARRPNVPRSLVERLGARAFCVSSQFESKLRKDHVPQIFLYQCVIKFLH